MTSPGSVPEVSIILPTYNRAGFLSQALQAIRGQTFTDWELITVDDGSTDDTSAVVARLSAGLAQPTRYVQQPNMGPYGGRNTGLDLARGRYIAFYDSDDVWLPHHLADCVAALESHPEIDWVYGASQVVEWPSGKELDANTFYIRGEPRPFLRLHTHQENALRIIDDPNLVSCQILEGLYCGLQASVIRSNVFANMRFPPYRIAEDQAVAIAALAEGRRIAYFDNIHVIYQVHEANISSASIGNLLKKIRNIETQIACLEYVGREVSLSREDRRALARRLLKEYFWHLGYSLLWQNGRGEEALASFRRGMKAWPWDWRAWKTYLLAWLRYTISSSKRSHESVTGKKESLYE